MTVSKKYKKYNWYNLMDILKEAVETGLADGFLKYKEDIHKIEIIRSEDVYELYLNDVNVGSTANIGEMWETLSSCIEG